MPSYLIAAYVIFCVVPLGLALSIHIRRRNVERRQRQHLADSPKR